MTRKEGTGEDIADIRRLAEEGLAKFLPSRLNEAGIWLRDFGSATGDARYYALSDLMLDLTHPFAHGGGMPVALTAAVDNLLRRGLPEILDADDSAFASSQARQLHSDITAAVREA